MKKFSLLFACVGIISAATFGNGHYHLINPQEGAKAKPNGGSKVEAPQKMETVHKADNSTATVVKAENTIIAPSSVPTQTATAKSVHPTYKKTNRVKAKPMNNAEKVPTTVPK